MPKRMLRDWTESVRLDGISAEGERLFTRLIMKADDFGRFHADPRLVKSGCFPLLDNLRTNDIARWLDELSTRRLVFLYEAGGRSLLSIIDFEQRLNQAKAKFPPPSGENDDWLATSDGFREVPGTSRKFRPEEKRREVEEEKKEDPAQQSCLDRWAGLPEALNTEAFKAKWTSWLEYRRGQKWKPLKPASILGQWGELAQWGELDAIASIEQSVRQAWQGLFRPKGEGPRPAHQKPQAARCV